MENVGDGCLLVETQGRTRQREFEGKISVKGTSLFQRSPTLSSFLYICVRARPQQQHEGRKEKIFREMRFLRGGVEKSTVHSCVRWYRAHKGFFEPLDRPNSARSGSIASEQKRPSKEDERIFFLQRSNALFEYSSCSLLPKIFDPVSLI